MNLFLARICWNIDGWLRPSGVAPSAEGKAKGSAATFVSENGFGHEEWLFRPEQMIDGWRYGFLQPSLHAREAMYGNEMNAILYTIDPDGGRWYLGRIDGLVVLGESDAKKAAKEFKVQGWLKLMQNDLSDLGLSPGLLTEPKSARELVNVKFQLNNVHMLPQAVAATANDVTRKRGKNRYWFTPIGRLPATVVKTPADPAHATGSYTYRTAPVVNADRRHNRLQILLVNLLRKKYGQGAVQFEVDGVDIVHELGETRTLIEVKSEPDARLAIRLAIGQIVEYALFAKPKSSKIPHLVIVAPGKVDSAVESYLERLRNQFNLPIGYVEFNEKMTESPL